MKNKLIINKQIAIIGAGPVGLTMALLLQQKGANVTVYERDAHAAVRITGGSLDLHQHSGQRALQAGGLLADFYRLSRAVAERILTPAGQVMVDEPVVADTYYLKPEIDRNQLRQLLLSQLVAGTIQWGHRLTGLTQQANRYQLHFEGQLTAGADLVIVANGGLTQARSLVTDAQPQYTGTYLLQGEIPQAATACPRYVKLCGQGNAMVIADGHALSTHYIANGSLVYYVSFRQPQDWFEQQGIDVTNPAAVVKFLTRQFAHWDAAYHQLFGAAKAVKGLPMRYIPLDISWKAHHHITLIGDAAHLMPPFAGIGVNIGLEDALNLSENLTGGQFETLDDAIADYERRMLVYARESLAGSLQAELHIHTHKNLDEVLESRADWNEQLGQADRQPTALAEAISQFCKKAMSASPLKGTVKFVVGESTLFLDGSGSRNQLSFEDQVAACTITIDPATFGQLVSGELATVSAFRKKQLRIAGSMGLAMKVSHLFGE